MSEKKKYELARIAATILPGLIATGYAGAGEEYVAHKAVKLARLIVTEIARTEPK